MTTTVATRARTRRPAERSAAVTKDPNSSAESLFASVMSDLVGIFETMDWADDEIVKAQRRHRKQADTIWHAFSLLTPRDIGQGMGAEFVFRSHVRELLERVAAGADTRPPTAVEMFLACAHASLQVPLHGASAGLYFRLWLRAFPDHMHTRDLTADQVHYERLHATQMDDIEATLSRKLADPDRRVGEIKCRGEHHGKTVKCRYASA